MFTFTGLRLYNKQLFSLQNTNFRNKIYVETTKEAYDAPIQD